MAAITSWSSPIAIPTWKVAPALAYGNTVALKASGSFSREQGKTVYFDWAYQSPLAEQEELEVSAGSTANNNGGGRNPPALLINLRLRETPRPIAEAAASVLAEQRAQARDPLADTLG